MARVENTSERQYEMSAGADKDGKGAKTIIIPRGRLGDDGKQNGFAEVDDAFLAEAKKDKVVAAWFDSGDLVTKSAPRAAATEDDKKHK